MMEAYLLLFAAVAMFACGNVSTVAGEEYPCLPEGIALDTVVEAIHDRPGSKHVRKVTAKEKLRKLGAKCRKGKLVARGGKEIRFYQLHGCWGNPPADYQEILQNQSRELAELKRNFVVIEITCSPEGILPSIS